MILRAIRESDGTAIAVTETEILEAQKEMATLEGVLAAPRGRGFLGGSQAPGDRWLGEAEMTAWYYLTQAAD